MKYSTIVATTIIIAAKSMFTNISCDTSAECEIDEWCYDEWECVPKCNIVGGVNCTEDIGWDYYCNNMTGECVETRCNTTADPTAYCIAASTEYFIIPIYSECVQEGNGYECIEPSCNSTSCPTDYFCLDMFDGLCALRCDIDGGLDCLLYGPDYACNDTSGECYQATCDMATDPTAYCTELALDFYDMPVLGECVDYQCALATCNEADLCPSGYLCYNSHCIEDCNTNNYCGRQLQVCNDATGLCEYSQCMDDTQCSDDEYCAQQFQVCVEYCSDTEECPTDYVCDSMSGMCVVEDCSNTDNPDYCLETCGPTCTACEEIPGLGWSMCSTPGCSDNSDCAARYGDGYVCNPYGNCVADCRLSDICSSNQYCSDTTGLCELTLVPCMNDTDCASLADGSDDSYICVNVTNSTYGECEKATCWNDPFYCTSFAATYGVEFACTDFGGCDFKFCAGDDTACSDDIRCESIEFKYVGTFDLCRIPCVNDEECVTRLMGRNPFSNQPAYCNDGWCSNETAPTTIEMETTETHIDGVQGYEVMVVLGVITFFMILYIN